MIQSNDLYCNVTNVCECIDKYGVAIIPGLLDGLECAIVRTEIAELFKYVTNGQFDEAIPSTWRNLNNILRPLRGMLHQNWGLGQSQAVWNVRQNPKIIEVFSRIWQTNDLACSFDGLSYQMPPEDTNLGWSKDEWWHCDQTYSNSAPDCVQTWVTAYDVTDGDATLAVMPYSHTYHSNIANELGLIGIRDNWYKFTNEQIDWLTNAKGLQKLRIVCPAGSMVLWDSRTIHYGASPMKHRPHKMPRLVIYISMQPRYKLSEEIAAKRKKAFLEQRTTSHHVSQCTLFPKTPRLYGSVTNATQVLQVPMANVNMQTLI